MTLLPTHFVSDALVNMLGWMLLHAMWQGAALALTAAVVLWLLRNQAATVRHGVAVAALAACLIAPIGTTWWMHTPESEASTTTAEPATTPAPPPAMVESMLELNATEMDMESASESQAGTLSSTVASYQTRLAPYLPYAVAIWALGATGFALRLAGGWWWTRRLRAQSEPTPAHWQEQVRRYANEMGLATSVPLRWTAGVSSPMVVGWWQPVLLVPLGFLSGMPPHHVEMVLRHELAHIRRNDMLVNALQRLAETLLFFHPGVWWLSAQITREREWCCDDLAIADDADRITYATALSQLAASKQSWGLAAADGSLLARVQRILQGDAPVPVRPRWGLGLTAVLLLGTLGLAACASNGLLADEAESNTEETAEAPTPLMPSSPLSSLEPTVPPAPPEPLPVDSLPADSAETAPSEFNPSSGRSQRWAEADTTNWDSVRQAHREWREAWAEADTTDWDSIRQAAREWREAWDSDTTDLGRLRQGAQEWQRAWDSDTTELGQLRQELQEWQRAWDSDTTEVGQLRQELQEWQKAWGSDTTEVGQLRQELQELQRAWYSDTTEVGQLRQQHQQLREQMRQQIKESQESWDADTTDWDSARQQDRQLRE